MSRQAAIVSNKTISQQQARNYNAREWDKPSTDAAGTARRVGPTSAAATRPGTLPARPDLGYRAAAGASRRLLCSAAAKRRLPRRWLRVHSGGRRAAAAAATTAGRPTAPAHRGGGRGAASRDGVGDRVRPQSQMGESVAGFGSPRQASAALWQASAGFGSPRQALAALWQALGSTPHDQGRGQRECAQRRARWVQERDMTKASLRKRAWLSIKVGNLPSVRCSCQMCASPGRHGRCGRGAAG